MRIPLHAIINLMDVVPENYFRPPSLPERPVLKVIAYFSGNEYYFNRHNHGENWCLTEINERQENLD